jgi:hypothetical protein
MVIRQVIDLGELVEVALKRGWGRCGLGRGTCIGAVGFCGPCVCLCVFLLL